MKKVAPILFSSALIILGLIIIITSFSMKSLVDVSVGPGAVPRVLGFILVILSFMQLVTELRKYRLEKSDSLEAKEGDKKFDYSLLKLPGTILLCISFVLALDHLGFVISAMIYLFLQILIYSDNRRKKAILLYILISVVASLGIYLIFVYGFGLRLSNGILAGLF